MKKLTQKFLHNALSAFDSYLLSKRAKYEVVAYFDDDGSIVVFKGFKAFELALYADAFRGAALGIYGMELPYGWLSYSRRKPEFSKTRQFFKSDNLTIQICKT